MSDFRKYLNVYEFECELPGSGKIVKFKPINTGQIKKLLTYEKEEDVSIIENALDDLISSSVISEGFDINDLYLQDRFFLLVEIRRKTKGNLHQFTFDCKDCKTQTLQTVNLEELTVKKLKEVDNLVKLDENISIRLNHIKRGDQKRAIEYVERKGKFTSTQFMAEVFLTTQSMAIESIITPGGESKDISIDDKVFLLEQIPTGSYDKVKEWFSRYDFGLDFSFIIKCRQCGYEVKEDVPMDNFFF